MKYSNTVEYNINTKLDSSGLTKLQAQIKQLENSMQQMANRELLNSDKVQAAKTQLEGLNTALTNSFNSSLGILDLSKFRAELDSSGVSAVGLQSAFNMMGAEGQAALNGLTTQIANFNGGMERTSSQIDKIFTTFSNTFRWGLVSSFFSQFMNAIHSSVDYVKELDDSLTQIMLVTDYNRDSMNEFAKSANEAAKAVSMTTTGMTNASLIFAQQGYDLGQSQELATLSAKLANASQQDTATTSDQITAYMNAYGLEGSIEELTQQMDNWALIANVSAADVGELAQASQRAASMANAVGVSGEQLAAQIATIESVTREAPEQIGNGLKTLYARFSDIAAGKEDEDGFGLGKVTSELNKIGVQVLDEMGQIRDVGDIMEDLMVIWDDLDQTSKVAAAQALAGKYQVNRFMALMDNSDMYQEYKGATGSAATGTLDQMNEEFANSIEGRSAKLQASLEGLFSTVFNTDDIYPWMDAAQGAVDLLQQFFDALGGGKTVLLGITSLLTQAFSQNMARSINDMIANRNLGKIREQNIATVGDTLDRAGIDRSQGIGKYIDNTANQAKLGALSDAQYDTYMNNVQQWANAQTALTQAEEDLTDTINVVNMAYGKTTGNKNAIFNDEGVLNTQLANEERANLSDRQLNRLMQDTDFSDVAEKAKEFSQSLQNVENQMKKVNADSENYDQQMINLAQAIDLAGDKLAEFNALNIASDDMIDSILGDLTSLETKIRAGGEASEEAEKEIAELISMIGHLGKSAKDMNPQAFKQAMLGAGDLVDKKKGNVDFAQAQANRAEENALDAQKNIDSQQQVKGILDTLNAVQQLTFAWQAFQNLGSLWANEDLSTGEKVLQTIMNLTMAMPQLISAMQTLQGNSFLQNMGGEFLNLFNGNSIADKIRIGDEALPKLLELKQAASQLTPELERIGKMGEAGISQLSKPMQDIVTKGMAAKDSLNKVGDALEQQVKEGKEAAASARIFSKVLVSMRIESEAGSGALAILKTGFATLKTEIAATMASLGPFLLAGAAIAAIAIAIGQAQEQAKKAHQEAMSAFEDAKNAQQQVADLSTKMDDWKSKRQSGGDNKELAKDADVLADSLRELGKEEEANAIHLAAIHAENDGTAESFNKLENAINAANQSMSDQSALDTMEAANAILKDRLSTEEEIAAANEAMQSAALDYNLSQMSRTNGMEMGVLGVAGDEDLHAATMDWQSLNSILEKSVPGFAEITDENERLALALSHTSDEAQRAAIEIQQVLNSNENLNGSARDTGGVLNQRDSITRALENTGLNAEESLQLLVTIDDSSYETMTQDIQTVTEHLNGGEPFEIAIQAIMDEQETEDYIKSQLAAYEPKDEDVESEDFQSLSNMFMDNADKMGEEGTPFEDYSEDLLNNANALEEVVEGILRYDDAVQTLDKNLENWRDALNDTNEFSKEHIDAVQDLQETYADFLDLSEDMNVSEEFAANADNLELMEDAANGVEGAYEELANAAAEDILIHADVSDVEAAQEALTSLTSELPSLFEGVDIGGALDLSSVEQQINDLATATGWTAEQMAAYLNNIGISIDPSMFEPVNTGLDGVTNTASQVADNVQSLVNEAANAVKQGLSFSSDTEMTEQTTTKDDQIVYTNLEPTPGPTTTIESTFPVGSANPTAGGSGAIETQTAVATVTGVTYNPQPVTESQMKEMTGYGIKSEVTNGPGGSGGVKLKKGATASKNSHGAAGAGKSSRGSRPSSTGGGSCFVAGTFVSTWGGFKPIEQIKKGNIVLSYNEQTGLNEYSEVLQTMIHDTTELIYTLYIKDEQLRVTGIHRFLIIDKITCGVPQWVHAADLKVGDWVMFADGSWHVIHKIEKHLEHQIVYNFEVSGNHNYYVGRNQILAHNKGGKSCFIAGTKISTSLGFKNIETIKPRDIVLSYNEQTKQNEYSSVIQTMIHDTKESIYTLYIKDEKLRVTGIHRFFITHNIIDKITQWIQAENLHVGDWVLCADGTWHVIWKIEVNIEQQIVYNFEVSGNHNYYVGRNQILAHNKGGGKKGKGSGGKAKTIEPKEKKEHEKDYYEEVNSQLDKTEKILSKIEKEEDRLIGDKAQANQNKQLRLIQKEIELNKEKLKLQKQELKDVDKRIKQQDKLAEKLAAENNVPFDIPDVVLDEDGMVANYERISDRIDQIHNGLIDKYNAAAAAGNEELTKTLGKTIEKFDKYGEEILKNIQKHNKLKVSIEESNAAFEEFNDKIEDIRIDAFKAHQEAMEELTELSEQAAEINTIFRDFNEDGFLTAWSLDENPIDDMTESMYNLSHAYGMTKKDAQNFYQTLINEEKKRLETTKDKDERKAIKSTISYYQNQKKNVNSQSLQNGELGMWTEELTRLEGWINGTSKEENPFGENTAALWDAYKNAYEHALEAFKKQKEEVQKLRDSIIDAYDEQEKALDRNLDKYDRLSDKLERVNDTYQLYYGEDNYEQILDLMEQQGNTMESQLNQLNNAYTYWSNQYQEAIKSGDKKLIEEIEDKMNDAEDAMLDKAEELAEHWVEMFEKSVEANTKSIYNKLFNNKDIEELTSNWELQKDYMQRYKDDIEKTYELDKLRSKYIDLLNDAQGSSLQIQNKIRQQMQEQLKQLQDQATVSEYDVKLANAKLEILQKQIALEDAQRNKNQMQLRRDTQGNYRYVYRANQDDVKAAQDDLLDSEYNAYELTKNETIANNDRALALVQDFLAKRADIFNRYKDDDEARTKALAELSANYSQLLGALEEDFKNTTNGMYDVLTYLVQNATGDTSVSAMEMLNNLFDEEGKFKDDTEVLWADLANTVTEMLGNFEDTVSDANSKMITESNILKEKMVGTNGALTKIGSSAKTVAASVTNAATATDTLRTATKELFDLFTADDINFQKAIDKVAEYEGQLQKAQGTTSKLKDQLSAANRSLATATAKNQNYERIIDYVLGAKNFKEGDKFTLKKGTFVYYDNEGRVQQDTEGNYGFKIPEDVEIKIGEDQSPASLQWSFYPTDTAKWGKQLPESSGKETRKQQGWHLDTESLRRAIKADTGGYTGNWNEITSEEKNGKLAFLHKKELILNAQDTENILSAVSLMRDVIKGNVNGIFDIGNLYKSKLSSLYNPVTEQRVEIQASFPNATDAEDIKQALIDLSDKAYQYAHRRNTFLG